jgi:hypothetical protein
MIIGDFLNLWNRRSVQGRMFDGKKNENDLGKGRYASEKKVI